MNLATTIVLALLSVGVAPPPDRTIKVLDRDEFECDLAETRARLAWAKGKKAEAAAEWQKVLKIREMHLLIAKKLRGLEDPDAMRRLEKRVVAVKVELAEVEGDTTAFIKGLDELIGYYEEEMRRGAKLRSVVAAKDFADWETKMKKELASYRKRREAAKK